MKHINVALTDSAYKNLKTITESHDKNQSDIVSEILEKISLEFYDEKICSH